MSNSNEPKEAIPIEVLLVPPRQAGVALHCGLTKVYQLIGSGALETVMIGRARRIKVPSIRRVAETGAP